MKVAVSLTLFGVVSSMLSGGCSSNTAGTGNRPSQEDGGNGDGFMPVNVDGGSNGPASPKRAFFLRGLGVDGDLRAAGMAASGIAGADALCARGANAQGFASSRWKAWISTSTENAIDRIADVGPWYEPDSQKKVANNKDDLFVNGLRWPVSLGPIKEVAWTGSDSHGKATRYTCNDWTESSSDVGGYVYEQYDGQSGISCSVKYGLLCFEQ